MSTSQFHGKAFEREVISTCFGVPKEIAESFNDTAIFDIPLGVVTCKHPTGNPVSIKTAAVKAAARAATVCLSDARRVWSWREQIVLVVGLYNQIGDEKHFHSIYEFRFNLSELERSKLYGEITLDEVTFFHERLKSFEIGQHAAARAWAKTLKKAWKARTGVIQLNPKIDSKNQRRLQCSAAITALVDACEDSELFRDEYRGLQLPYVVSSSSREFRSST